MAPAALAARYGLAVSGARPSLRRYTAEVWRRRHFVSAHATAKLTATYSGSRLGQLWQVMTPLLNAAVYYLIFGLLFGSSRGVPNYIAYLCTGVFVYNFTQTSVLAGTKAIQGNLALVRALHFPRACLPLSITLSQLQQLLFSMAVLTAIVLARGEPLTPRWLLAVPALALQSVFNAGLAMALARLGAKVTDVSQLMPFILRTWMYFSGVFYDPRHLAGHFPHAVSAALEANPTVVYIALMRYALLDSVHRADLPPHLWTLAIGWALAAGIGGYLVFWRGEEEYGRG
ncbi:ABC transporter permease [Actinomadura sp. PM05-2]|uniref:Transport permease protein n=1 Tax=Actinomadura parmotrematis TaxID=2864039 RepID=A0ABS7FMY6_9ACTN|nr:ABC transporter permease [Actinomadura parmotrematis]